VSSTEVVLDGLTKGYDRSRAPAVDQVSLDIEPGTLVALLGPSGCGKSTTLNMIAGLLEPDAGDIRFDGQSVVGLAPERRPVSMVFQKPLLFPHMGVARNVGFGLRMRRTSRATTTAKVRQMLDLVRLGGLEERGAAQLSGGQEQRVSLARALVIEPRVLLLDEPFSQLDANLRVEMRELVATIQRELGVTSLFVTHDQEEAVALAHRVALMLDGRIVQCDVPEAFYARPASLQVARFFGGQNVFPGVVERGRFTGAVGEIDITSGVRDGPGVLVVRHEAVELVPPGSPGATDVLVQTTTFLGTHVRVHGSAPSGADIYFNVAPGTRLAAGETAAVRFAREHCHVVPPEEQSDA